MERKGKETEGDQRCKEEKKTTENKRKLKTTSIREYFLTSHKKQQLGPGLNSGRNNIEKGNTTKVGVEGEILAISVEKSTTLLEITDGIETFERGSRRTTNVQQQQHYVISNNLERNRYEQTNLERQIMKCTEQLAVARPEQRQNEKTQ